MSFNSRKILKQNNNNNDGGGGVIISGEAKKISAGQAFGLAIDSNDQLINWNNDIEYDNSTIPKVKHIPEHRNPFQMNPYSYPTDEYLVIGLDDRIILGTELTSNINSLEFSSQSINDLKSATNVIDAGFSGSYLWYLKSDGTLKIYYVTYSNGYNTISQTISNVAKCSINFYYGIILKTDGTLHPWSYTEYANPIIQYNSSLPSNLNNIKDISCGFLNPTILKHSGEIVEWGTFPHRIQARIPKPNISNAIKISAGFSHTLALLDNGTVVGWGFNNDNQIDIPAGLSNIIDISAGYNYSMALRSDGKIICWGNNYYNLCDPPERFKANIKTTKKIIRYNDDERKINFLNNLLHFSSFEYGYNVGNTSNREIQAHSFNIALSIPKAIYSDENNYLNEGDFILGGDNYNLNHSSSDTRYNSVFSIFNSIYQEKSTAVNTDYFVSYGSPGQQLIGNYVYYRGVSYPYPILRYISALDRGEAVFKDAIFLKDTSDPDFNNSLIIVGAFTMRRRAVIRNNQSVTEFIETSNFFISDERGYQSDTHNGFNLAFNFEPDPSYSYYQNTKVPSNGTFNENNIAYKSSRTIRTIKQYKKDYIIFGDDNLGLGYNSRNFYVRKLGPDSISFATYYPRNNSYDLDFWVGRFKTNSPYTNKGVFDIEVQDYDDKVLVAGNFISYDKQQGSTSSTIISTPVNSLCRLTSNFDSDTTFNTNLGTGFNDTVNKICIQSNNKILVGGKFTSFNGVTTNRLVRLNSDGTRDNTFNIGTGFDGEILDIVEDITNGDIYVSGNFNYYNNENISGVVKLKQNGSLNYYFDVNKDEEPIWGWTGTTGSTNTRLVIGQRNIAQTLINNVNKIFIRGNEDINNILFSNTNTIPSVSYETYDNSTDIEFLNVNNTTKLLYANTKVTGLTCQNQNLGGSMSVFGYPNLTKIVANNLSLTSYYSDLNYDFFTINKPYILNLSFNSLSSSPFDLNPFGINTYLSIFSSDSIDINMMNNSLTSFSGFFATESLNINLQNNKLTRVKFHGDTIQTYLSNTTINLKNNNLTSDAIDELIYDFGYYYIGEGYIGLLDISGGTNSIPSSFALGQIDFLRQNGWTVIHN